MHKHGGLLGKKPATFELNIIFCLFVVVVVFFWGGGAGVDFHPSK